MLTDFRKVVNRVTVPAGWEPGAITSKMFRHTYASSRLRTVDRGAPVVLWTVEQELGHGFRGHDSRQHEAAVADRLRALRRRFPEPSDTTSDTAASEVT
jgi:integrase